MRATASSPGGEEAIVHEVAAALAQPYGIIQAYERGKETAAEPSIIACRGLRLLAPHDPQRHARARDCLERATEAAPPTSRSDTPRSRRSSWRNAGRDRADDEPPLQRALHAARRAVEFKPGSARAHQALAEVQFARGDYPLAIEAGERAMTLNPYDPSILAGHGVNLVASASRSAACASCARRPP